MAVKMNPGVSGNSALLAEELPHSLSHEQLVLEGDYPGRSIVNKFGRNPDVDTGAVPEDIWNGGGVYAGFPTGAAEEFEVFSSSASDTGVLTFTYLPSFTATSYSTATVTLNGTTAVSTGVTGVRMHTAQYSSGNSTGFNIGAITVRHKVTTANVFCVMPIGRSQTNTGVYTVPFGTIAVVKRFFCRMIGSTTGQIDGALWARTLNGSPRLRRPFTATTAVHFEEAPYGGLVFAAGTDLTIRISFASANNLEVIGGFDLEIVTL